MDRGYASYLRYLDGDDSGLSDIIKEYGDGLAFYLRNVLGNFHDAEEAMEDTFVKLAVKRPRFKGESSFKTWLYTVGRNCAIDRIRRESRHSHVNVDECGEVMGDGGLPLDEYLREERRMAVNHAMEVLSEDYRQVLCLVYFEGFSISDAAVIMKRSRKAVDNLLYRARLSLKKRLEEEGFVYEEL